MKRIASTKKGSRARPARTEKVIVYIDGFNLYFGLKSRGWARFLWLDLNKMAQSLLKSNQTLVRVKYFTSRIRLPHDKSARQNTFLEVLETLPNLDIFYGNYQINKRTCRNCGAIDHVKNEKMTDVNIATEMLTDAFLGKFDTALLISADGDLTTPVKLYSNQRWQAYHCGLSAGPSIFYIRKCRNRAHVLGTTTPYQFSIPPPSPKSQWFYLKSSCCLADLIPFRHRLCPNQRESSN